jgi:hypothetical protein
MSLPALTKRRNESRTDVVSGQLVTSRDRA